MSNKTFKTNEVIDFNPGEDEESLLSLYDKNNPDKNLFNLVDEENIRLGGSKLFVYKYYQSNEYDDVYMESRSKAILTEPIVLFGHYDPREIEENLSEFGLEMTNDQIFTFNKSYVEKKLGRGIIPGDVIKPAFQEIKFKVFEVQESSFEAYGIYHLLAHAKVMRESEDVQKQILTDISDFIGGKIGNIDLEGRIQNMSTSQVDSLLEQLRALQSQVGTLESNLIEDIINQVTVLAPQL